MSEIDWIAIRAQAEEETIAEKSAEILANPDEYECHACCIEGQPCDVGLAVKVERERIIKLLEINTPNNHGLTTRIMNWIVAEGSDPTVQDCADFANEIIALINGEN